MEIILTYDQDRKTAYIRVEGAINNDNAHIFGEKLTEVLTSGAEFLEFDFSTCRNINSTGLGKLLLFYRQFIKNNGEIEVVKASQSVYEILTTIKLNQLFSINL